MHLGKKSDLNVSELLYENITYAFREKINGFHSQADVDKYYLCI